VRLLLDTQIFIWAMENSPRLKAKSRRTIAAADRCFVSLISAWEIAIKAGLGRITPPEPIEPAIVANGFAPLMITFDHVAAVQHLPNHHRDPFDRLLIAQALTDGLTFMSADRKFAEYGIAHIPA
jgi:PIN domain nuclease of toxin-antitoxin system